MPHGPYMFVSSSHAHPVPGVRAFFTPALPAGCNTPSRVETQISSLHSKAGPDTIRQD